MMTGRYNVVRERSTVSSASPSQTPHYKVGDPVRVRAGVHDPDNPDLPIGRWCGTVTEIEPDETPPCYLIRWDARTRQNMPPVFVTRCQLNDLEIELMWLDEDDLEPDDGAALPLEQPTALAARPLRLDDQDDRLRGVFGLTADDPVPNVEEVTLRLYHAYLVKNLAFPFEATWVREDGPPGPGEKVTVLRLEPPEEADAEDGLLCVVRAGGQEGTLPLSDLECEEQTPQGRLLEEYTYWFANWPGEAEVLPFRPAPQAPDFLGAEGPPPMVSVGRVLQWCAVIGAVYGATLGATATLPGAQTAMFIGSAVMAGLMGLMGRRWGIIVSKVNQTPRAPVVGLLGGVLIGGALGVLLGAMAVAFVGSISGSIVGTVIGGLLISGPKKLLGKFLGGFLGACVGGIIFALVMDQDLALAGLLVGSLVGVAGMIFLVLVTIVTLSLVMGRRG
jgi:hypothetical protein